MKNNHVIVFLSVLVTFSLLVYFLFIRVPAPLPLPAQAFSETGIMTNEAPGLNGDAWYLIFERPGEPALAVELQFSDDSICHQDNTQVNCHELSLVTGTQVHIEGLNREGVVEIERLNVINQMETIQLFYYNPKLDEDEEGNLLCSRQGIVAVEREMALSEQMIEDTIRLLIMGNLTAQERQGGLTTEFPLPGFTLEQVQLQNGQLTLIFNDAQNQTVGGSCRVGILWMQIEATAKQFSNVREVVMLPEDLFQP